MSIIEFIFGKSDREKHLERAERFYLAGKITKEQYETILEEVRLGIY